MSAKAHFSTNSGAETRACLAFFGISFLFHAIQVMRHQEGNPKDWVDGCGSLGAVSAPPQIPITSMRRPERECSCVKSSANVSRLTCVFSEAGPEELTLRSRPD